MFYLDSFQTDQEIISEFCPLPFYNSCHQHSIKIEQNPFLAKAGIIPFPIYVMYRQVFLRKKPRLSLAGDIDIFSHI